MKFTFKKGEKIFEVGEYARSKNSGNAVFKVLTAGPLIKWTKEEAEEFYKNRNRNEPYYSISEGKIKFQENVTLQKVGRTVVTYVPRIEEYNGRQFTYSTRISAYEAFDKPSKRVIALTEDNYHIYRPAVLVIPENYYLLVGIKPSQDIFLESTTNVEFEKLKFPSRIIDLRKRRVYHDGKWRNVDTIESL